MSNILVNVASTNLFIFTYFSFVVWYFTEKHQLSYLNETTRKKQCEFSKTSFIHSLVLSFRIFFRSNENYWPISQVLVIFFFLTSLLARAIIRKLRHVNCDIYTISLKKLKFCLSETGITEYAWNEIPTILRWIYWE